MHIISELKSRSITAVLRQKTMATTMTSYELWNIAIEKLIIHSLLVSTRELQPAPTRRVGSDSGKFLRHRIGSGGFEILKGKVGRWLTNLSIDNLVKIMNNQNLRKDDELKENSTKSIHVRIGLSSVYLKRQMNELKYVEIKREE